MTINEGNEDLSPENEGFSMQFTSADVQFYNIGAPRSNSKAHRWCQAVVTPAAKEVYRAERVKDQRSMGWEISTKR